MYTPTLLYVNAPVVTHTHTHTHTHTQTDPPPGRSPPPQITTIFGIYKTNQTFHSANHGDAVLARPDFIQAIALDLVDQSTAIIICICIYVLLAIFRDMCHLARLP